jgi:hypothetical protein
VINFDEIKIDESTTYEQACAMLRLAVQKLYNEKHIDEPFFNYEVGFMFLGDTEEYKQFKGLLNLNLGDRLKIKHQRLNIDLNGRMIAYEFNCLTKKYNKIELGTIKKDINMTIKQTVSSINYTKEKFEVGVATLDERLSAKIELSEKGILDVVDDKTEGLQSQIYQQANGFNIKIGTVNDRMDANDGEIQNIYTYFDFTADGMAIGKSDSPQQITIDNVSMQFLDTGTVKLEIPTVSITGNGSIATATFATQTAVPYSVGSNIEISGAVPTGYNGIFKVTACTTTSVSWSTTTTGNATTQGKVKSVFVPDSRAVAYIHGQNMNIGSLEVLNSLIVGVHKIEKYNNDITLIRWVGGSN